MNQQPAAKRYCLKCDSRAYTALLPTRGNTCDEATAELF